MIGIYAIKNKENGKVYVGKSEISLEKRKEQHFKLLVKNNHYNKYLQRAYNRNPASFEFEVIERCDLKTCNEREIFWIDKLKSSDSEFGYNLTLGGEGGKPNAVTLEKIRKASTGRKHSQYTKDLISNINRGTKRTEEEKNKISLSKIGKKPWNFGKTGIYSEETIKKMSISQKIASARNPNNGEKNGMFGKRHSEETKLKMSKSRSGNNHCRYIDFTDDQWMEIIELRTSGITYLKIAKIFGVHEETIRKKINWVKKGDKEGMQNYFASRIKAGKLDYLAVVTRYPQFKDGIDEILINDGYQNLIVEI